MNIIAAHRQGLIEQLDEEVAALAGRNRDHAQRAIVLHHLFDHSRGGHLWALAEARRELRIAAGLGALRRRLDRWGWIIRNRDHARDAIEQLAEVMGSVARQRTLVAYRAYRLSGTRPLSDEAAASMDSELHELLEQCHAARRTGETMPPEARLALAEASERLASAVGDDGLQRCWAAIDATGLRRVARRLLGAKALARHAAKDQRRGTGRAERALRLDQALPAAFRANPAQHFYALQRTLQERRRQQWRLACDQVPDAFELAA